MSFSEVLGTGWRVMRHAYGQYVVALAIPALVIAIVSILTTPTPPPTATLTPAAGMDVGPALASMLVSVGASLLQTGALVALTRQVYLEGRADVGDAYRETLRRFGRLLGVELLGVIAVAVGTILLIIPGMLFGVWFSQVVNVLFTEDTGVWRTLGRSRQLVRGHFWRVVGVYAVSGLALAILAVVVAIPVVGVSMALRAGSPMLGATGAHVPLVIVEQLLIVLVGAFPPVTMYVQYIDLRRRRGETVDVAPPFAD